MQTLVLNSVIHGVQHDAENSSNKQTIVLIHGLFGNLDNLSVIRRHFENDYQILSIDLPDHGLSPHTKTFSFEIYANSVIACLKLHGLANVILVGHSLGGKVAMAVAHKIPHIVNALVVLDIAPVAYSPRHHEVFAGLNNIDLTSISSRKDAQVALAEHVLDAGTQAFLLKGLYQNTDKQWSWRFNLAGIQKNYALLSDWQYSGELYSGNTLFIKGADSDYLLAEHQSVISPMFPNAKAKIVQAGHWLHAQKPQIVNSVITNFLRVN